MPTSEISIKIRGNRATWHLAGIEHTLDNISSPRDVAVKLWRSNVDIPRETRLRFDVDGEPLWPNSYVALGDAVSWRF